MKKIMKLFVLVAAAAMALASCQKNEIDAPAKQGVHFTINAALAEELPEAKTAITDNGDGTFTYEYVSADNEDREFQERMYRLPMPDDELENNSLVKQYPEWR